MTIKSDFNNALFDRKKSVNGDQAQANAKNTKAAAFFSAFFVFLCGLSVAYCRFPSVCERGWDGSCIVPCATRVSTQFPTHFGSLQLRSTHFQLA
jgi:hypothetical protein